MLANAVTLVLLFVSSCATAFVVTGIVRRVADRTGLVDVPDARKIHSIATPRLGGLAIIFGFGFPLLLLAGSEDAAQLVSKNLAYLFAVLASGALIVGLGIYDDLVGADAPKKFAVQIAAASILVFFGFRFDAISVAGQVIPLSFAGAVVSVIWIVGVINAMNLIDGIDSLATVVAITIAAAFIAIAFLRGDAFTLVIMTALLGSLLGFYPWNKPPAKIFMGDTGSLFIGLLLAACSIARPSKSSTAILIIGPVLALALPVLDTLLVMHARLQGKAESITARFRRLFSADRNHIHHLLIERHGSVGRVIVRIWLITLLFGAAAVMSVVNVTRWYGYALGALTALILIAVRLHAMGRRTATL